jgi:predicted ABC-type sugar transport system permease subunit
MSLIASHLAKIEDAGARLSTRASIKEAALLFRRQARRYQTGAKLADAVAKFGGGSLLTATLLLILNEQAETAVLLTAGLTLLLFVAGIIFWTQFDLEASQREFEAEWLEAVLKEMERM